MAGLSNIPLINPFDTETDPTTLAPAQEKWVSRFTIYITATGVKDAAQKWALLLHLAGLAVQDIFSTLTDTGTDKDFDLPLSKLTEYFAPQKRIKFNRQVLWQTTLLEGETTDAYITCLCSPGKYCGYDNLDDKLADHVLATCSDQLCWCLYREDDWGLTFQNIQQIAHAVEAADSQANRMAGQGKSVNLVTNGKPTHKAGPRHCYRCGKHGHVTRKCLCSKKHTCEKRGKLGIFRCHVSDQGGPWSPFLTEQPQIDNSEQWRVRLLDIRPVDWFQYDYLNVE